MYLTFKQIEYLIQKNIYTFSGNKYQSRCFSGHFTNSNELPALALPGGDIGELAIIVSAGFSYGFEYDILKCADIIKKVAGAGKSMQFQHSSVSAAEDCRYLHLLSENPEMFALNNDSVELLFSTIEQSKFTTEIGDLTKENYKESACIIFQGEKGLLPHYFLETTQENINTSVFIYHKRLIDERRKIIASLLCQHQAIKLMNGLDDEYLYEILSETGDIHLYQTLQMIDNKLPIYSATYPSSGDLQIEEYS